MADTFDSLQVAALRKDYMLRGLSEEDLSADPVEQFRSWFQEALRSGAIKEPNAMVLSTVSAEGRPSGRYVLLKGFDQSGFIFYTNGQSDKARDLAGNPFASLTFGWIELERQVRIDGTTSKLERPAVEAYFRTRPRGSRLGAWASSQSEVIAGREVLSSRLEEADRRFPEEVPAPPEWCGYLVKPERIEFWQGRTNRLHDRLRYRKRETDWCIERLAP